jgi:hypothetical protein
MYEYTDILLLLDRLQPGSAENSSSTVCANLTWLVSSQRTTPDPLAFAPDLRLPFSQTTGRTYMRVEPAGGEAVHQRLAPVSGSLELKSPIPGAQGEMALEICGGGDALMDEASMLDTKQRYWLPVTLAVQRRAAVAIRDASLPLASWHLGVATAASCSLDGLACLVRLSYRRATARRGCAFRIRIWKMKNKNFWPRR